MSRHFLANLSVILILNLVIKPLYIFGIEVSVQNVVGASSYGLYFAILNSAYLLQVLNDFGLQIYNNRNVALDENSIRKSFGPILRLKVLLSSLFVLLFAGLCWVLGYLDEWRLVIPVGLNLILMSFVLFLRSNISGLGLYRSDSLLSVLDKVLMIVIVGYLLFISQTDFTILHFAYAQSISLFLTSLVALAILMARKSIVGSVTEKSGSVELLRKAAPFAIAVFLMTIYTRVDGVMIEQIAEDGAYQSGLYAAGYRLLDAANMIAYLFSVLLLPMFTKSLSDLPTTNMLMSQGARVMLAITVGASALCIGFRHEIMSLLYTESTSAWADTFGVLIASFIAIGGMYVFGTYLTARGEMKTLNLLYVTCVAMNIGLNIALIPGYGALGAAVATLITQSIATASLVILSHRKTAFPISPGKLIRAAAYIALAIGIIAGSARLPGIDWYLRFIIAAILIVSAAFITGLVRLSEVWGIIRR